MGFFDGRIVDQQTVRMDDWGILEATDADEGDGTIILHRQQDCEPILESNARMAAEVERFQRRERVLGRHAARVPNLVIERWCQLRGISYQMMMSREGDAIARGFLNDPENSKFRIWPGKL